MGGKGADPPADKWYSLSRTRTIVYNANSLIIQSSLYVYYNVLGNSIVFLGVVSGLQTFKIYNNHVVTKCQMKTNHDQLDTKNNKLKSPHTMLFKLCFAWDVYINPLFYLPD